MQKIIIFTGAGFGVPMGLPTTSQFNETIDKNCTDDLKKALQGFLRDKFYDIESILSTLEFFVHNKSYIKHLLDMVDSVHDRDINAYKTVRGQINGQKVLARNLILELKKSLFTILSKYDKEKSILLYQGLFQQLIDEYGDVALSIFTTNYDLTFDKIRDELDSFFETNNITDVINGFTVKNEVCFFDIKKKYEWDQSVMEYKKLHGSLDWIKSDNRVIKLGEIVNPNNPDDMLLLYPGLKETPNNEPYNSFHEDLLQRLLTADVAYVIGFAFRDEYINNQFETAFKINKELKVYCYNPIPLGKLPSESKLKSFVRSFKGRFNYIEKGIEIDPKEPLMGVKLHALFPLNAKPKSIRYVTWNETMWTASLSFSSNQQPYLQFEHRGTDTHEDMFINYKSDAGDNWTAICKPVVDTDGNKTFIFQHNMENQEHSHDSPNIRFLDWENNKWDATVAPMKKDKINKFPITFICRKLP